MKRTEVPVFIKVPCIIYDVKEEQLTGQKAWIDSFYKFNIMFIVSYMPHGYERDGEHYEGTWIQSAGHGCQSPLSIDEFEKMLQKQIEYSIKE